MGSKARSKKRTTTAFIAGSAPLQWRIMKLSATGVARSQQGLHRTLLSEFYHQPVYRRKQLVPEPETGRPKVGGQISAILDLAVLQHLHFLERHQSATHHFFERRQESINLFLLIHDFDDYRQVIREPQDLRGVQLALPAEAHRSTKHGAPGKLHFARFQHDGLIERTSAEFVVLAGEYPQQDSFFRHFHFQLPLKRLIRVANTWPI